MDITQLTQSLVTGLEQKNADQLTALSRVLNMVVGKMIIANVTETAPVTDQERQELLKQTLEALAQLNKQNNASSLITPALKAEIARLTDQAALIKSPELMWVNLQIKDKLLLTYTDQTLQVGQQVPLQRVTAEKLVLLALPNTTERTPSTPLLSTPNSEKNTYPATLNSSSPKTNILNDLQSLTAQRPINVPPQHLNQNLNAQEIISDNLRNLLPYKDIQTVLYKIVSQWHTFPKTSRQAITSPAIDHAIKQLSDKMFTPLQLSQPRSIKSILSNAGIFFESNLNSNFRDSNFQDSIKASTNLSLKNIFSQDIKGALLNLSHKIYQELSGADEPLKPEQSVKLLQQIRQPIPNELLVKMNAGEPHIEKNFTPIATLIILQQLMTKPVKELSDKELRTQLLTLLQQHSLHSLAKIQLQQLTSLQQQENPVENAKANSSFNIEVPIKFNNDVQQLQIHINREWIEEKNSPEQTQTISKIKQWSVTLRFDLPTLGEFCAQFSIVSSSMSATLWAAQESTLVQVKSKMDWLQKKLEHEGIQVTHLQCLKGMPPEKPIALGYSLIDVST
jgi:Flagellar hook-length control protein FliK